MSLYEVFEKVRDPRRKEGLRTNLAQMFCMITISNLCGHFGGRPIARFSKAHETTFVSMLGLKHGVPSHVIFSDVMNRVNSEDLIRAFNNWASSYVRLKPGAAISGDGKSLASTLKNQNNSFQDFEAIVSLFCQESGLVQAIGQYRNRQGSEIDIVQFLIKHFKDKGMVFHFDALHTQKNC